MHRIAPSDGPSRKRRLLKRVALVGLLLLGLVLGVVAGVWTYLHPRFTWTRELSYGERHGEPLRIDVLQPAAPNGLGVLLMVSGSWKSGAHSLRPWLVAPLLRRGYTIFAVHHVSQPKATVMEIVEDVTTAARFVRTRAAEFGVDPTRLGVTGGSSGGHLSLMLATRGLVGAAAVFFPVTDLLNLDGGPPKSFTRAFAQEPKDLVRWKVTGREMSPLYHVTPELPPVFICHGDADTLVPLDQSQRFLERAREVGATVELRVHPGFGHGPAPDRRLPGWIAPVGVVPGAVLMMLDIRRFADWFDRHLKPGSSPGTG
jgi:acetyl esterase/lipase